MNQSLNPLHTRSVYPREESVERVIALLVSVLGLDERASETKQLRELLFDEPGINSLPQLQDHLADLDRSGRLTPELANVALRLRLELEKTHPGLPLWPAQCGTSSAPRIIW